MQTMHEFVEKHGFGMQTARVGSNPNMHDDAGWERTASHWNVTITHGHRRLSTYFSQGSAIHAAPSVEDILNSLALDSSGYENANGFEDWARELGMEWELECEEITPRRAEDYGYDCAAYFQAKQTYKIVGQQRAKLKAFLGPALYEELLYKTEGL